MQTILQSYLILNDIRSAHNVGSLFRTADCMGVSKIFLCGTTPTPLDRFSRKRKDIAKVALGAEDSVSWEYQENILEVIEKLKQDNYTIVSLEQDPRALSLKEVAQNTAQKNTALVVGNEVEGVSKEILDKSDFIAEIPLRGSKESLNVSVASGIALFIFSLEQ